MILGAPAPGSAWERRSLTGHEQRSERVVESPCAEDSLASLLVAGQRPALPGVPGVESPCAEDSLASLLAAGRRPALPGAALIRAYKYKTGPVEWVVCLAVLHDLQRRLAQGFCL